jgi:iron complex outermembrane receptor protein
MRSRGVEVESLMKVTRAFTLTVNGSYSDAKFKDYTNACYSGQPVSSTVGVGCYVDPVTKLTIANYAGERLTNAPKWTYSIRGSYERPVAANLLVDASLSWAWRSESQTVAGDPKSVVDAYGILNLNAGLGRDDGKWRVGVYARNLLNEHFYAPYASGTLNPGGYYRIMSPDAFRTVGASLNLSF